MSSFPTSCPCQFPGILPIAKSFKSYREELVGTFTLLKVISNGRHMDEQLFHHDCWTSIVPV